MTEFKEDFMRKFRTAVSLVLMVIAAAAGLLVGSAVSDGMGGAILFSLIVGIACIVYTMDNPEK